MLHPEVAGLKKSEIKAAVAKKFKASEDRIAVFGVRAKYGGGRSSGFVTVYDDLDARVKYDTKTNLNRVSAQWGSLDVSNAQEARAGAGTLGDCSNGAFVSLLILRNF